MNKLDCLCIGGLVFGMCVVMGSLLFVGFTVEATMQPRIDASDQYFCDRELDLMLSESENYFIIKPDMPDYYYSKLSESNEYGWSSETGVYVGHHKGKWDNFNCDKFYNFTVDDIFTGRVVKDNNIYNSTGYKIIDSQLQKFTGVMQK